MKTSYYTALYLRYIVNVSTEDTHTQTRDAVLKYVKTRHAHKVRKKSRSRRGSQCEAADAERLDGAVLEPHRRLAEFALGMIDLDHRARLAQASGALECCKLRGP